MKILIYGAGNMGKSVLELIENDYDINCDIVGFIDKNKCGQYCGYPIYKLKDVEGFKGRIIIALSDFKITRDVCRELKAKGYTDIFWFQYKKTVLKHEDFFIEQCSDCKDWRNSMLFQVEMHIMDSCNLNCRGCAHFSPIFPSNLPDLHSRLSDVKRLKEKLSHIVKFFILGGEPFLNPEIDDYIRGIRKILPNTQLYIVTNGLLIERLSEETLQCIKDYQVWISVSEYQPIHERIDNICSVLNKYKILYEIREASQKENFNLPLSLSEHSKYPQTCISNGCVTIWNGKIARCPQLMYISHFNKYFNTSLPEEGVMELKNCVSGEDLLHILKEEVPLCRHCIRNEIGWDICGKKAKLEDFAVFD